MKKLFVIALFICNVIVYAQKQDYIKHKIQKGETVTSIAKKYKVTPFDIYELNPDAKISIKENDTLLIKLNISKQDFFSYKVLPKETLYAISRKFGITLSQIKQWNPLIDVDKIKEGEVIKIDKSYQNDYNSTKHSLAQKDKSNEVDVKKTEVLSIPVQKADVYIIQKGETLYGISKKYNISEEDLIAWNPILKNGFKEGIEIKLIDSKSAIKNKEKEVPADKSKYVVLSGDTFFQLAQKFDTTVDVLTKLNPEYKDGLIEGAILNVPVKNNSSTLSISKATKTVLYPKKSSQEKTVALFLPFNVSLIEADTTRSVRQYLKSSTVLNVSLDFYAGALVAVDSLKKMGYNIRLKVIDSELSKDFSSLSSILDKNKFSQVDAVIGPLHNSPIEQTATYLSKYNIPVISPISTQHGNPISNLYYAMPSDDMKMSMLIDFVKSKNGTITAIIDSKRKSTKEILSKFPEINMVPLTEKGSITTENVVSKLDSGKKNFILVDSERAGFVSNAVGIVANLKAKYNTQLVVLEVNDAFEFQEMSIKRLTSTKLMYPSILRKNNTGYYKSFVKKFLLENNTEPNKFASRGFDVTFDTVLRIYSDEGFENSTKNKISEHLESKFDYVTIDGGNYNKGVYFLYYDDDLTIKIAE